MSSVLNIRLIRQSSHMHSIGDIRETCCTTLDFDNCQLCCWQVYASPRLLPQDTQLGFANASMLPVDNAEYANGTLTKPYSLNVWYDWVNVSNTQVIAYAMYTPPDSPYPGPIANIVGQHLHLADGTEVFVASALTKFEVYRDLNGDGIPQANFTSPDNELLYYMYTNMSDKFSMTPIQMVTENSVPHYQWGISYQNVYGYLGYATV